MEDSDVREKDDSAKIEDECFQFLKRNYWGVIYDVITCKADTLHFPVLVDYFDLNEECPQLGESLLNKPKKILQCLDKAAKRVLVECYIDLRDNPPKPKSPSKFDVYSSDEPRQPKPLPKLRPNINLHVRVHTLPTVPEIVRAVFPGCKEAGSFLCLLGTVVRAGPAKVLEYKRSYRCTRCKNILDAECSAAHFNIFVKPCCPNLCVNGKMEPVNDLDANAPGDSSKYRDYQEVKLQEQVQKMDFGAMPKAITVILEDDLTGSCKPGDDVAITGYLFLRWKQLKEGLPAESELVFKANHVLVNNDQKVCLLITNEVNLFVKNFWDYYENNPYEGRNVIIQSFCPQVFGMYVVKLGMCTVLAGGVSRDVNGSKIRGESHMLLVGDPGTGKSQLLKYASKLCPRSVLTTGIGTSSAGLTVSAVKDSGEWHLEAGALVLADGGVCCIDEFSCIKEHDRTSIHEAMEQQCISIAKAGMTVNIPTRTTILAATNPKGKYDPEQPLTINVGIASPLLSRFDLVMVLTDVQDDEWDNFMADFILGGRQALDTALKNAVSREFWSMDHLQCYLVMIKELKPELTPEAKEVISKYYEYQRGLEDRNAARTTVRLLESLRRLSEGHARLMNRKHVLLHDAVTAISLLETSMQTSSMEHSTTNTLHSVFPEDSLEEYRAQAKLILPKLGLDEMWEAENKKLDAQKMAFAAKKNNISTD